MKQIYIGRYFRSGYSRFMQYINNILDHPKREIIEERIEIIKFLDKHGIEATKEAFHKGRSTPYRSSSLTGIRISWKRQTSLIGF